jgi:hypothetical protein
MPIDAKPKFITPHVLPWKIRATETNPPILRRHDIDH